MVECDFCHGAGEVASASEWIGGEPRMAVCPRCGGNDLARGGRSRRKGARGERDFIARHLAPYWPGAKRNLDQFGDDKRDVVRVAGAHFQIKRQERLNIWAALEQAAREATGADVPIVAFRRNRSDWYCALRAEDLIALLAWSERDD